MAVMFAVSTARARTASYSETNICHNSARTSNSIGITAGSITSANTILTTTAAISRTRSRWRINKRLRATKITRYRRSTTPSRSATCNVRSNLFSLYSITEISCCCDNWTILCITAQIITMQRCASWLAASWYCVRICGIARRTSSSVSIRRAYSCTI